MSGVVATDEGPLRLLILSDGRAGHVSTSRGIAELIGQGRPCRTEILPIRLRAKFLRPLLRLLVNSGLACRLTALGPNWPRLFYRGYRPLPADAVISAGGDTIYLNAYEGRCLGRVNFFCGSLRGVRADRFDLIVHTRQADLPNWQAMEVLPAWGRPEEVDAATEAFVAGPLGGRREGYWSVLIGGDGNGYRLSAADAVAMLDGIAALAGQAGRRLLVTTSRRTDPRVEAAIEGWASGRMPDRVAYLVLYNRKPERLAGPYLRLAEAVFCTEDSTSMISEAVLAERPVLTLSPPGAAPVPDQRDFLDVLAERVRIHRLAIGDLGGLDMAGFLARWRPYEGEDHRRLRERMLDRLGRA